VHCRLHRCKHVEDIERPTCCSGCSVSDVRCVLLLDRQYNLQLESKRLTIGSFSVNWLSLSAFISYGLLESQAVSTKLQSITSHKILNFSLQLLSVCLCACHDISL
jgi:hypothetical protein